MYIYELETVRNTFGVPSWYDIRLFYKDDLIKVYSFDPLLFGKFRRNMKIKELQKIYKAKER